MSDQFTPTTEQVRFAYIDRKGFIRQTFGSEADDDQAASTEFDTWLASVKAEAWDEAVEALDRSHGDIYPIAVKSLDRRNPHRKETPDDGSA